VNGPGALFKRNSQISPPATPGDAVFQNWREMLFELGTKRAEIFRHEAALRAIEQYDVEGDVETQALVAEAVQNLIDDWSGISEQVKALEKAGYTEWAAEILRYYRELGSIRLLTKEEKDFLNRVHQEYTQVIKNYKEAQDYLESQGGQ
jgi:phage gp29-like protein